MPSSRRHFLSASAASIAGPALLAQSAQNAARPDGAAVSANDRVQIALIGAGGMGTGDVLSSLQQPGVQIVAAADVYDGRLARAKERWGDQVFTTRDFREVLDRKDVDAVIVATPDHLHAPISIAAMKAGKDVYCEKPMVQRVEDGLDMVDVAQKTNRILQVGSQRVSSIVYAKARDLIRQGAIGQVNLIEAWWDRNSAVGAWQYSVPTDASPQTIDWDRFLGPAPKRPFEPVRLFRWRSYKDYGTGVPGDLFVHLFSGMHFIMDSLGPSSVYASGGLRYWKDGRDVPDVMLGLYSYDATPKMPAFNLALRVNFVNGAGENSGFRFVGSEGVLTLDNGITVSRQPREKEPGYTVDTFAKAEQERFLREYRQKYPQQAASLESMEGQATERYSAPRGYSDHLDHHRNFISAVRTRKPVIEDAAFGLRAAGPAVLSNMSQAEGKVLRWDPQGMKVRT